MEPVAMQSFGSGNIRLKAVRTPRKENIMIKIGDKVPSVTIRQVNENGVHEVKTDDFFKGKRVALFAVPGAFTSTCSAKHLPSYVNNADALRKKGVDVVACT